MVIAAGGATLGYNLLQANPKFTKKVPIIVIHGGTSGLGLTKEEFAKREAIMQKSLLAGQKILTDGGSATDAVIVAIKIMEDNPLFNAGKGAVFTADGFNELDASLMDGSTKKAGAVAMSRAIKNPIEAARVVMEKTWHTLIAGEGADKLAKENGLEMVNQKYYFTQERYNQLQEAKKKDKLLLDSDKVKTHLNLYTEPYLGTVGAAALDSKGNLAAGTSTGGMTNKMTGRIGDSPIIGAGTYADNDSLALSCTGTGDIFIRVATGHEASSLYKYKKLSAQQAVEETIKQVAALGGEGGIVSVDKNGIPGFAWTKNKLGMFHGLARVGEKPQVFFPVAR
ncbi:beta-aspartyl-peptidase [Helicobacter didelphidarum]|uniref:Isoaspartyl peptidase n=2 Tax=Helicobacter didelphidarum TaxID=2040648 RepID=A0A3D8IMY7_9HELI|nr:beta-aspartyl-peptidase [Helicobacter didelphidarum]